MEHVSTADLRGFLDGEKFATVMADPPWRFQNRTGKIAPEHKRLDRYPTMKLDDICALPVEEHLEDTAHCYLWAPNALLPEGLKVLEAWGFTYKSNLIWHKIRKDGGSDGRGVGFYFRNVDTSKNGVLGASIEANFIVVSQVRLHRVTHACPQAYFGMILARISGGIRILNRIRLWTVVAHGKRGGGSCSLGWPW